MSRLFILLFSVIALMGFTACAQAQDTKPNAEIDDEWDLGFGEELEQKTLEAERATKELEQKTLEAEQKTLEAERATKELEQKTREAEALQKLIHIGEKPTGDEWDLGFGEELEAEKAETARTAAELEVEKAETARTKAELEREKRETEAASRLADKAKAILDD